MYLLCFLSWEDTEAGERRNIYKLIGRFLKQKGIKILHGRSMWRKNSALLVLDCPSQVVVQKNSEDLLMTRMIDYLSKYNIRNIEIAIRSVESGFLFPEILISSLQQTHQQT